MRGEHDGAKQADLLPDREDIAAVYRYLRREKRYRHGPTELFYRLSESRVQYARVLVALQVLDEMGLVTTDGAGHLVCADDPPKVDLEASGILRKVRDLFLHN